MAEGAVEIKHDQTSCTFELYLLAYFTREVIWYLTFFCSLNSKIAGEWSFSNSEGSNHTIIVIVGMKTAHEERPQSSNG